MMMVMNSCFVSAVLGTQPRASHMPGKHSTTELYSKPHLFLRLASACSKPSSSWLWRHRPVTTATQKAEQRIQDHEFNQAQLRQHSETPFQHKKMNKNNLQTAQSFRLYFFLSAKAMALFGKIMVLFNVLHLQGHRGPGKKV